MCVHGTTDIVYVSIKGVDAKVDACIAPLVSALNVAGFGTLASCCGHGNRPGVIALADGRELIIAKNWDEARKIDGLFEKDIHGRLWDVNKKEWVENGTSN